MTTGVRLPAARVAPIGLVEEGARDATPPPFCLVVDDVTVAPFVRLDDTAIFVLPAGTGDARLVSSTWSPRDADPRIKDDRRLGLLIEALSVRDLAGGTTFIPLDDARLARGFHPLERSLVGVFRWTDGDAHLPAELWAHCEGAFVLRLFGTFGKGGTEGEQRREAAATKSFEMLAEQSERGRGSVPFRLDVDGVAVAPLVRLPDQALFVLPAAARDIKLVSPTWSPRDTDPASKDDRRLGLYVKGLSLGELTGEPTAVPIADTRLAKGFHPVEQSLEGSFRWTDGEAHLVPDLWKHCRQAFLLHLHGRFENAGTNPDGRALVLRFENIGCDCEFGTIQKLLGAEPLGLLRWNEVPFRSLMNALDAGFEGLGAPENTEITCGAAGEYFVRDKRWGLDMHTFIKKDSAPADRILSKMCRHISFLREKFLNDLREARKTFIYKHDNLALWELRALHDACRQFGPVRLLHIKSRGEATRRTTHELTTVRPDLYLGCLDKFDFRKGSWDARIGEWLDVCAMVEGEVTSRDAAQAAIGPILPFDEEALLGLA